MIKPNSLTAVLVIVEPTVAIAQLLYRIGGLCVSAASFKIAFVSLTCVQCPSLRFPEIRQSVVFGQFGILVEVKNSSYPVHASRPKTRPRFCYRWWCVLLSGASRVGEPYR